MRIRLTLIAVAFAALAVVGLRHDAQRLGQVHHNVTASGQLAGLPAPDPDVPSISNAALTMPVTSQTLLNAASCRNFRPEQNALTIGRIVAVVPTTVARPRTFPLLI